VKAHVELFRAALAFELDARREANATGQKHHGIREIREIEQAFGVDIEEGGRVE